MLDVELKLVETTAEAAELMSWLGERRPLLGMDTETEGLKLYAGERMRLFQVGDGKTGWAVGLEDWRGLIKEVVRRYDGPVVFSNAAFDFHAMQQAGLPVPEWHKVHDTVTMSRLVEPLERAGLKEVGERYFPGSSVGEHVLNEAKRLGKWTWATIPIDHPAYWQYSALDPVLACLTAEKLWPQVQPFRAAYDREMAVRAILYRAERRGMKVDVPYTSELRHRWGREMDVLMMELNALGLENPNSARQIAAAMQLTEKWEPDEWTETGLPKMDNAVLVGIDSEITRRVLRFRRLKKWCSTYLDRFLSQRDANDRVHPSINTLQARTGRMSITGSAGPLQCLPRGTDIRACFEADPGHKLWTADYDSMEMRGMAHYANATTLKAAIRSGISVHVAAGRAVYNDPDFSKHDPRYTLAKNTGFCLIFGGGKVKIAETAGVHVDVAAAFLSMYLDKFPEVGTFMRQCQQIGEKRLREEGVPYITTWGGRRAPADIDRIYALLNYLIQGSCADIFKSRLIAVDAAGFGDNILVPIHDELLLQFPDGDDEGPREVAATMEDHLSLTVPLTTELTGPYDNWGEKYAVGL